MKRFCLVFRKCVVVMVLGVLAFVPLKASGAESQVPGMAILPFISETDPNYGVFIADLLVAELMYYRRIPGWQHPRFDLVEPDTLPKDVQAHILDTDQKIQGKTLEKLKAATRADFVILGRVIDAGTKRLQIRMVNTNDGSITWTAKAQDDVKWVWIYPQRQVGEIVIGQITAAMGFTGFDRRAYNLRQDEIPNKVAALSFYASQRALVPVFERVIQKGITDGGLLELIKISNDQESPRLGLAYCQSLQQSIGVDAILYGSMMVSGKDESTNNATVILRLIDTDNGHIVWACSSSGRRVWRKDDFDEMAQAITSQLLANLSSVRNEAVMGQFAQLPEPEDGVGWVALGTLYLEQGVLDAAEEAFLKADTFPDSHAQALLGLGKVYAKRPGEKKKAIAYFQQSVQSDSTLVEPYFFMAQTYTDMRISLAVDMAEKAIALDSTYSAAYLIIADWFAQGDWYATREEDDIAADFYRQYLSLVPTDLDAAQKLGRVLLRQKRYDGIERYILPLLDNADNVIVLLPIAAQWATEVKNYDLANKYWTDYLNRVNAKERAQYKRLNPVLPEEAISKYEQLTDDERDFFGADYWQRRDPDPTSEVNERLLEHYVRISIARQSFADVSYPWDRRGDVFIRYGAPDYRSRSNRVPAVLPQKVEQVKSRIYSDIYNEAPVNELVGTVFPVRSTRSMMAEELGMSFTSGSLTMGDGFMPVTGGEDHSMVPWESWVYTEVGGGIEITFTDEMGVGRFDFAPMPMREMPGLRSVSRLMANAPETVFNQTVHDRPEYHDQWANVMPLNYHYDFAGFKSQQDTTLLDVFFGIPMAELKGGSKRDGVELAVALTDSVTEKVYRAHTQYTGAQLASLNADGNMLVDLLDMNLAPGRYKLTTKVARSSAIGVYEQPVDIAGYATPKLQMSDFIVASKIWDDDTPGRFKKRDVHILPMPSRTFAQKQQMGLYFEGYHLQENAFGQTNYEVTVQIRAVKEAGGIQKLLGREGDKPEVSLTFSQTGDDKTASVYLYVDLDNILAGKNLLRITLHDLVSGEQVSKEGTFHYVAQK